MLAARVVMVFLVCGLQLAMAGPWSTTRHAAGVTGQILSIEADGQLRRTVGASGTSQAVGEARWLSTRLFVADGAQFLSVGKNGQLYSVSVKDGQKKAIGAAGLVADVRLAAASAGVFFGITRSGKLLKIDLATGTSTFIGKPQWATARMLMAGPQALYVVDNNSGILYRVNRDTGAWKAVGQPSAWAATPAAVVVGDRLFSVEKNGEMYETLGQTGQFRKLQSPLFLRVQRVFTDGKTVFIVDGNGVMDRLRL
jgi:hypothetical protein